MTTSDHKPQLELATDRATSVNLFELAYLRLEDGLVDGSLAPGRYLTMLDLQTFTGFGRTPVHHAVNRLAADTLIHIRPRHGLQIAPIDLNRERLLLRLRRDIERFVVGLAAERCAPAARQQMQQLARALRDQRSGLTLFQFNAIDRSIDRLILDAAAEPFLEHTLQPLHTIFRRIGHIHHTHFAGAGPGAAGLDGTIRHHLDVLDAVANGQAEVAKATSDALIDFVDGMFDDMVGHIDGALLDCSTLQNVRIGS